ncbi:hypothetical protein JTB14_000351 [Gonioctena quinquepunctata]|nr:hypothetical protein JTB14_000351 [Gonioctena quinquepunctata]
MVRWFTFDEAFANVRDLFGQSASLEHNLALSASFNDLMAPLHDVAASDGKLSVPSYSSQTPFDKPMYFGGLDIGARRYVSFRF